MWCARSEWQHLLYCIPRDSERILRIDTIKLGIYFRKFWNHWYLLSTSSYLKPSNRSCFSCDTSYSHTLYFHPTKEYHAYKNCNRRSILRLLCYGTHARVGWLYYLYLLDLNYRRLAFFLAHHQQQGAKCHRCIQPWFSFWSCKIWNHDWLKFLFARQLKL